MGSSKRASFLSEYHGRSSSEAVEQAQFWVGKASTSKAKNRFLKKGHLYRRKEFKYATHGYVAYDMLLANDITLRCLRVLADTYLEAVTRIGDSDDKNSIRAIFSLLSYLSQICTSVQSCILRGEDLPARVLMRSVIDASDYLLAVFEDQDLASNYVNSQDDDFKKIWSDKLRPKQIRKLRRRALEKVFAGERAALDELIVFIDGEYEANSRASHPSYEAGVMILYQIAAASEIANDDDGWDFLRRWPHLRVSASLSFVPSVPLSLILMECLRNDDEPDHHVKVTPVENSFFKLDMNAIETVFHGQLFAGSLATHVYNSNKLS